MMRYLSLVILAFFVVSHPSIGADVTGASVTLIPPEQTPAAVPESLRQEAYAAIQRASNWLLARQMPEGHWSNADFPALTALPVWAMVRAQTIDEAALARATAYMTATFNENGSFCRVPSVERKGGGLCNYNTALVMVALHATGDAAFIPMIQQARTFIAATQHFGDDIYHGGMGYDPDTGRPYADLSNSILAYEAMRLTESVEDLRQQTGERADLDWEAARQFIQRVQNRPESNDQPWAGDDPADYGGFAYKPDSSMAGSFTNEQGEIRLRSYGSMTYAGLLSFIYAAVDQNDPRVQSAFDWARRHWTLEENPGMGLQGLFYYFQTLAKALNVIGVDVLTLESGASINWRVELIKRLISLQQIEADGTGYWVNSEGRWWEADPTLVTAYSLLALDMALR
ncbi:MAG TPA: hypothetical protein PKE26_05510 [Kiritimatiellia bacterium]|nr:hypothetical protein [Kiritimatiellia bacterium]HMO98550.1 hypothetical protein [Kiritimatiellia bacterium]HMP97917.1 hypothetical protein [Kiritimatiellia bacterium]